MDNDALAKLIKEAEQAWQQNQLTDKIYGVREGAAPIAPWPTQPCTVLFLDFDGVLNSESSAQQTGNRYRFSQSSVHALNRILQATDSRIVITSSWRENWTLVENAQHLEKAGVLKLRVVGRTAVLGRERGYEIDAWLRSVPYPVKQFAILDDRDDMVMHQARLVRTDPKIGLTEKLAAQAIALLS